MISTTQNALQFYSMIARDPNLLAKGYTLITDYLIQSQQNRSDTLLNILDTKVPVFSLVMNVYPQQVFSNGAIDDAQKDSTIQFLLNTIVTELLKPNQQYRAKEVDLLFDFMNKIHNVEGFQRWVNTYKQVLGQLALNSNQKFGFFLVKTLKYADDRVSSLSQQILPHLISHPFDNKEDQLEILYYMLKSLSIKVETDPQALQKCLNPYFQNITTLAVQNMRKSLRAIKFSLKTLTLLIGEYEQECEAQVMNEIQNTSQLLMKYYIQFLNSSKNISEDEDEEDDQSVEGALYQMMELFSILLSNQIKIRSQKALYFCVVCTFLRSKQYKNYVTFSDQYLMDVQDEGDINIRNKAINLLNEFLDSRKKKVKQFLKEYVNCILSNLNFLQSQLSAFLVKYQLPQQLLKIGQIYLQSALFITTSFTDQLFTGKVNELTTTLGTVVKQSAPHSIQTILSILIMNKSLKNQNSAVKTFYLNFLKEMSQKYSNNIGMLIAIARGIYQYSPIEQLFISNQNSEGIPIPLVQNLSSYLLGDDSAQQETAYLILQFLVHLLKCEENRIILQNIVSFDKEIQFLKLYIDKGMSSVVMMKLTEMLANPQTLEALYKEIQNGFARDQNLSNIIGKCIKNKTVKLNQNQIIVLCKKYEHKIDIVSNIIAAFLQVQKLENEELVRFLSAKDRLEWLPGLLQQGKVQRIEQKFVQVVTRILNQLQSLDELENALLLPYFAILNNAQAAIQLLNANNIFVPFVQKVYRYAKLFKGSHLRIISSHVFINLAQKVPNLCEKVIELVKSYGKIEGSEWQDQEVLDLEGDFEQSGVLDKLFDRIVNENVEQTFKQTFGELSWDSQKLNSRLAALESRQ